MFTYYFIVSLVSTFIEALPVMNDDGKVPTFHAPPSSSSGRLRSTAFPLPLHHYGVKHDDYLFSFRELFEPREVLHGGKRFLQNFSYVDSDSGDSVSLEYDVEIHDHVVQLDAHQMMRDHINDVLCDDDRVLLSLHSNSSLNAMKFYKGMLLTSHVHLCESAMATTAKRKRLDCESKKKRNQDTTENDEQEDTVVFVPHGSRRVVGVSTINKTHVLLDTVEASPTEFFRNAHIEFRASRLPRGRAYRSLVNDANDDDDGNDDNDVNVDDESALTEKKRATTAAATSPAQRLASRNLNRERSWLDDLKEAASVAWVVGKFLVTGNLKCEHFYSLLGVDAPLDFTMTDEPIIQKASGNQRRRQTNKNDAGGGGSVLCKNCYLKASLGFLFRLRLQQFKIDELEFSLLGRVRFNMDVAVSPSAMGSFDKIGAEHIWFMHELPFKSFGIFKINLKVTGALGARLELASMTEFGGRGFADGCVKVGIAYDKNRNALVPVESVFFNATGELSPLLSQSLQAALQVYLRMRLSLQVGALEFVQLGGPYVEFVPAVEIVADIGTSGSRCSNNEAQLTLNVGARASLGAEIKLELGDGSDDNSSPPLFSFELGPIKLFELKFPIVSGCVSVGKSTAKVRTDTEPAAVGDVWIGRQTPAQTTVARYFDMQVIVQLIGANAGTVDLPDVYLVEYTGAFKIDSADCQPKGYCRAVCWLGAFYLGYFDPVNREYVLVYSDSRDLKLLNDRSDFVLVCTSVDGDYRGKGALAADIVPVPYIFPKQPTLKPQNSDNYVGVAVWQPTIEYPWSQANGEPLSEWQLTASKKTAYKRQWQSASANMMQQEGVTAQITFGSKDPDCDLDIVLNGSPNLQLALSVVCLFVVNAF